MNDIKFKREKIKYPTLKGFEERTAYSIGDYSYGKDDNSYSITHNPSGLKVKGGLKIFQAKELTLDLSLLPIKWNGLKKPPKKFLQQIKDRLKFFGIIVRLKEK